MRPRNSVWYRLYKGVNGILTSPLVKLAMNLVLTVVNVWWH
jgi:hypothetical protein